ncbi:MAG TPA: hypothetical protein VFZ64_06100 [Nocardioidaceae bacterium]
MLEDFGGLVCGDIVLVAGTDASQGARVRVRWFTANEPVGAGDQEEVETFALEPSGSVRWVAAAAVPARLGSLAPSYRSGAMPTYREKPVLTSRNSPR